MARYQIQTPYYLDDIINEMAEQGWKTLKIWGALEPSAEKEFATFRKAIRNAMDERIRTYKLLGISTIFTTNVNDFVLELTSRSILSIENIINPEREDEACTMLSAIIKLVLEKYLYIDPVCGKAELCIYSASARKEIWQKKNVPDELIEEIRI